MPFITLIPLFSLLLSTITAFGMEKAPIKQNTQEQTESANVSPIAPTKNIASPLFVAQKATTSLKSPQNPNKRVKFNYNAYLRDLADNPLDDSSSDESSSSESSTASTRKVNIKKIPSSNNDDSDSSSDDSEDSDVIRYKKYGNNESTARTAMRVRFSEDPKYS